MDNKTEISYVLIRWLFIRFLSLIYFFAFLSYLLEAKGLYGTEGILPVAKNISPDFFELPTLFLFWHSDSALISTGAFGLFFSILAFSGILTGPLLFLLWFLYLSIVNAGNVFMSFQWDILLLEAGFLAIFLSSWKPLDLHFQYFFSDKFFVDLGKPPVAVIWLFRFLLFRLMFASGLVKIKSGDETWHNLSALSYHYETQPLPTPGGWIMHQFPDWFQSFSTLSMFFIELIVPFLFFAPRKLRYIAGFLEIALQILIILTGNYCFFNLLTIALCLFLFDDNFIEKFTRGKFKPLLEKINNVFKPSRVRFLYLGPLLCLIIFLSLLQFPPDTNLPGPFYALARPFYPYHLVNSYGLFAVMTVDRPEIIVEGSEDGESWQAYQFKYKAGPLDRPPCVIQPLQPRLDWQMWFASLGEVYQNGWFVAFIEKLLEGSSDVLSLLDHNPFPDKPPRLIRARVYNYEMTDPGELLKTGNWWKRTFVKEYLPPVSLIKDRKQRQ